jgi:ankyrin repeat/SOCS box protein 15
MFARILLTAFVFHLFTAIALTQTARPISDRETLQRQEAAILQAIAAGDLAPVKRLADGLELRKISNLPLFALASKNADVVEFLRTQAELQISDLQIAAIRGDSAKIKELLSAVSDAERQEQLKQGGSPFLSHSPLMLAVRNGKTAAVESLIQSGANVDEAARENLTPLANAAELGQLESMKLLLAAGASVNLASDGYTPLMRASFRGQPQAAALLIAAKCKVNVYRHDGRGALHFAVISGNLECVQLLLQHGADPRALAYERETPLQLAELYKRPAVAQALRDAVK